MLHGPLPRIRGLPCRDRSCSHLLADRGNGQSFRNLGEQPERSELTLVETFLKIVEYDHSGR